MSQQIYVWTAYGTITHIDTPKRIEKDSERKEPEPGQVTPIQNNITEKFDNDRRVLSSKASYLEIPPDNIIKTRMPITLYQSEMTPEMRAYIRNAKREAEVANQKYIRNNLVAVKARSQIGFSDEITTRMQNAEVLSKPIFKFITEGNDTQYTLNILIRARVNYKYKVPVMGEYMIVVSTPEYITDYQATYASSSTVAVEKEKRISTPGAKMQVVVDPTVTYVRITASFVNRLSTKIEVYHGIKTDDPYSELYCEPGSYASLVKVNVE